MENLVFFIHSCDRLWLAPNVNNCIYIYIVLNVEKIVWQNV